MDARNVEVSIAGTATDPNSIPLKPLYNFAVPLHCAEAIIFRITEKAKVARVSSGHSTHEPSNRVCGVLNSGSFCQVALYLSHPHSIHTCLHALVHVFSLSINQESTLVSCVCIYIYIYTCMYTYVPAYSKLRELAS